MPFNPDSPEIKNAEGRFTEEQKEFLNNLSMLYEKIIGAMTKMNSENRENFLKNGDKFMQITKELDDAMADIYKNVTPPDLDFYTKKVEQFFKSLI